MVAEYLRLVWKTSRLSLSPPMSAGAKPGLPVIIAMWQQHFLMPFIKHKTHRAKA